MVGKLDDYMRFNEAALSLRSKRQEVLASNIANADTPNYKARDFDFASALKTAVGKGAATAPAGSPAWVAGQPAGSAGKAATLALATTNGTHLSGLTGGSAGTLADGTPLLYRQPAQGAVDGNTVDMDVERNQFADNSIRYEAGVTMVNSQIKGMLTAIQGQ